MSEAKRKFWLIRVEYLQSASLSVVLRVWRRGCFAANFFKNEKRLNKNWLKMDFLTGYNVAHWRKGDFRPKQMGVCEVTREFVPALFCSENEKEESLCSGEIP
jgi:hypothetical protein